MDRRVNVLIIEEWMAENGPQAAEKLAVNAKVSPRTISNARNGEAPKRTVTCIKFAKALGLDLEAVFPTTNREEAS